MDVEIVDIMEEFVVVFISYIDVVEKIVVVLMEFYSCGYFLYVKFDRVVFSFVELQMLIDFFKFEFVIWNVVLLRVWKEFLCFNFFWFVELWLIF